MRLFLKSLAFTVVAPGSVGLWIPLWIAARSGADLAPPSSPARVAALVPVVIGAAIYLWCAWDFAVHGHGTPAPLDAPRRLVVRGLYRSVRNPMYLGVALAVVGWWLYFALGVLLLYGAAVLTVFQLFVLCYEEPHLRRLFGEPYERYCQQVRRWIPGRPFSEQPPAA
jgi:protein-S-isoprenylcysteine O-methyltransferase Ste14